MILSDEAEVKKLSDVEPGSLLLLNVGRDGNVFAIAYKDAEEKQCVAVLNPSKVENIPYEYEPDPNNKCVLDFGTGWFIDVKIKAGAEKTGDDKACPDFTYSGNGPLIRKGAEYFLCLVSGHDYDGNFLNLTTYEHYRELPRDNTEEAHWHDFKIYMPQSYSEGQFLEPQLMLHWGELMEKKRAN